LLEAINWTLEGFGSLRLLQFDFVFLSLESVRQELEFLFNKSNKGGRTITSVVYESVLISMEKLFLFTGVTDFSLLFFAGSEVFASETDSFFHGRRVLLVLICFPRL
jgi:hypothetical protein